MANELSVNTNTQQYEEDKVSLPVGLTVFVIVIALLIYGAYKAYEWLQDEQQLPVQSIVFTGELSMISPDWLETLIRESNSGSFFAIDVNEVHQLVESQAWVYSASIRKRWPSSLYIHIVEQKAVAQWNDDMLLNKYGESFDGISALKQQINAASEQEESQLEIRLPKLFGPGGSEKTALTGYQHMRALLRASGQKIKMLNLSERFAWTVKLENGITLNLGRQEYIKRLQRFIDVFPLLKDEKKAINYIDLRYDTGLAVGWADAFPISAADTDNNTNN